MDENIEKAYRRFVDAAEGEDSVTLGRLIREHPDLHSFEGDDGGLLDVIRCNFRDFLEEAFLAGLHPDSGRPAPHQTLLQHAACDSDLDLMQLCLRFGADIERRNCEGETALGYAASWASLETVRVLVEAGADVNAIKGNPGEYLATALDSACSGDSEHDRPEVREYLRACGAKCSCEIISPGVD